MTYDESSSLMNNQAFRGRIKVACLKFSTYILGEPANTTAHNSRYKWAQLTAQMPEQQAQNIQPMVAMDAAVQAAGIDATTGDSTIDDAGLQAAVEDTVNKII